MLEAHNSGLVYGAHSHLVTKDSLIQKLNGRTRVRLPVPDYALPNIFLVFCSSLTSGLSGSRNRAHIQVVHRPTHDWALNTFGKCASPSPSFPSASSMYRSKRRSNSTVAAARTSTPQVLPSWLHRRRVLRHDIPASSVPYVPCAHSPEDRPSCAQAWLIRKSSRCHRPNGGDNEGGARDGTIPPTHRQSFV